MPVFDPFDPPELVIEPPPVPEIVLDPPASYTVHVVPVTGPPGPQGEPGLPGDVAGQLRLTVTAGAALSGHRMVTPNPDGTLRYASNALPGDLHAPMWLTLGAAASGAEVNVLVYGALVEPSWAWTPGPLYLGAGGLLTQTPPVAPAAVFLTQIGFATGPTSAFFDRMFSINLA